MPTAPSHALLALNALIDELDALPVRPGQADEPETDLSPHVADARSDALKELEAADRLDLFDAASQALAVACARREIPQPARAAAYSALVGLVASDLLPQATLRTLYASWEKALGGLADSPAILRGEEILLHIG